MPTPPIPSDLLHQAHMKREQARRCRAILREMHHDGDAASLMTDYAMELEERAEILEGLGTVRLIHGRTRPKWPASIGALRARNR